MKDFTPTTVSKVKAYNYSQKIEKEAVEVVIKTKGDFIFGFLHIRPIVRIIDDLLNAEKFVAVTNATIYDSQGKVLFQTNFMALNRDDVTYVIPRSEIRRLKDPESMTRAE